MTQIAFAGRAIATLAVLGAVSAFAGAACAGDAYEAFVTGKAPAPAWAVADGGYGSQGFHHGLPTTEGSDVFAVNMIPYEAAPDTAAASRVEPVAGGADAMRDASIFTYTPDADYGSRGVDHWLPQYRQD